MDLKEFLERLDLGISSVGTLQTEILAYRDFYSEPTAEAEVDDALIEQLERRHSLGRQLEDLLENIRSETTAETVVKRGGILTTAASLLNRNSEMAANYQIGHYLIQLDECAEAQRFLRRAHTLFKETEDYRKQFPLHLVSAELTCLETENSAQETENYVRELLSDYSSEEFSSVHVVLYRFLASAYLNQGKSNSALETARSGFKLVEHLQDEFSKQLKATFQATIGYAARSNGQYAQAISAFEAWRRFAEVENDHRGAAVALSEIGITWFQIGEEERGRRIFEQAAQEAEQAGFKDDAERWRASVPARTEPTAEDSTIQILVWAAALIRQEPPRFEEARRLAVICVHRAKEERDWRTELDARNLVAAIYNKERKDSQAIAAAREAVRGAARFNDLSRELTFRINLASCYFDAGRIEDAENEVRIAIEKGKLARASATTTEIRQAISAGMRHAYEVLAVILAQEWTLHEGKTFQVRTDKLFEVLQETRAGNFAGWVAVDNIISTKGLSTLNEPLLQLRASDVRIEMEAVSRVGELTGLLEEQERARQRFAVATAQSGLNITIEPPIYSAKELQQSLRAGECFVDLYGLPDHILVTILKPQGDPERVFLSWPATDRSEFLSHWRTRVALETAPDRKGKRLRRWLGEVTAKEFLFDLPTIEISLSRLIEQFKAQFVDRLVNALGAANMSRLIIVPHRELALLPFWVIADNFSGLSISVVPGSNVHKLISERLRSTTGPRLAIKDPTGSLDYAAIEVENLPGFEILSSNVDEIVRDLGRANILHCAGHGMFNDQNPYLSGIIAQRFAGPQPRPFGARTPRFNEELLTVAEVLARTRLPNCYLVTLSACSTGLPRQHPANEFIGLPTAFLIAGAKNVIGSLWPVDDAATCLLMREFYAELVRDSTIVSTPSAALASARDRLGRLRRSDVVEILGKDSDIIPDLEFPYAGPEYTLAFQHFGVD